MGAVRSIRAAGERGALVELPGNATVRKLIRQLPQALAGLEEVVAGHETVLLVWEPGRRPPADLREQVERLLGPGAAAAVAVARHLDVPVIYDGPDLADVARHCGLSPEAFVRRHQATTFEVGFIGFSPGFAYLLGGDEALRPPRRDSPRERIPQGSLAIAGEYSAVYPAASPGGWNLIGRALVEPFDLGREPQALLHPGMRVRFVERP